MFIFFSILFLHKLQDFCKLCRNNYLRLILVLYCIQHIILKFMVMQVDFIIITCLAMLISVFLTYKFTNYLGLKLQLKPLLFCAFCALLINFTLPTISIYLAKYHLVFMLVFVLCAAFFIARYNENLNFILQSAGSMNACFELALVTAQKNCNRRIELNLPFLIQPKQTIAFEPKSQPFATMDSPPRISPLHNPPALIITPIIDLVKNDMENAKLLKLTAVIAKLPSLDSILEYAYDQNRQKAYSNSIFAFKQALDLYESDEYAPFIIIEIGNIYKNSGLYDEAIVIYNRAFSLPSVKGSEELSREFQNNISYLRITKTTLLKHNCLKLSFNQIPSVIMQEIESEFERWRNQKYAS